MSEKLQILSKINLLSSLLHSVVNWVFVGYLGLFLIPIIKKLNKYML